jgi:hypothetical protein
MGRAARLKRERKVVAIATDTVKQSPVIQLQNPVADSYAQFVIGNAHTWEAQAHDELIRKDPVTAAALEPYWGLTALIESRFQDRAAFDAWQRFRAAVDDLDESFVVKEGSAKGQHVVICGAGPSLAEEAAEWIPKPIRSGAATLRCPGS